MNWLDIFSANNKEDISLNIHKKERNYYIVAFSITAMALFFHMAALKLIYKSIELLLLANGATSNVQKEISKQVDILKEYANYCTILFFLTTYLFVLFIGFMLLLRKINLKMYLFACFMYEFIHITGLSLFIFIFNKYQLTEGFGRYRILHRHKLLWLMIIIPIFVYLVYGLIKRLIIKYAVKS
jgi:hypothetical protein